MATPAHDKYYLKSLHEEIDLFDRKLAHSLKYDTAGSEGERKALASKMAAKRETLARTARQLVSEGIEYKPADLPRSFRAAESPSSAAPVLETPKDTEPEAERAHPMSRPGIAARRSLSPFAGTVLDGQANIEAYKRTRSKGSPQA